MTDFCRKLPAGPEEMIFSAFSTQKHLITARPKKMQALALSSATYYISVDWFQDYARVGSSRKSLDVMEGSAGNREGQIVAC